MLRHSPEMQDGGEGRRGSFRETLKAPCCLDSKTQAALSGLPTPIPCPQPSSQGLGLNKMRLSVIAFIYLVNSIYS